MLPEGDKPGSQGRWWWYLLLALVLLSRLLALPGQPWEQDEALFAAAAFDTNLVEHRPHPPGFPLWVAVGKLGLLLLGDPLITLQVVSALASVATVMLLAAGWGATLDCRALGIWAGLLYAFSPGVWFHAPRAFSTTPALALAVAALLLWRRPGLGWLLAGAAVAGAALLVRPILAPPLLVAAVAAVLLRRERVAGVLAAAATGAVTLGLGFAPLVWDAGGPARFLDSVTGHGSAHGGALHLASWQIADLGLVKALGGLVPALLALPLIVLGWWIWRRSQPATAWWWLVTTATMAGWLVLAHNRTYPRYTLPLLALLSGPAVQGVARLVGSARRTGVVVAVISMVAAVWTLPAMTTQASQTFPPLRALYAAQTVADANTIIVDGALSPFTDLLTLSRRGNRSMLWRPLLASGRIPLSAVRGPWIYVWAEGTPSAFIPAPYPEPVEYACLDPRLAALSQQRYLVTRTSRGGGIILDPETPIRERSGEVRVHDQITLLVQPVTPGSWLGVVLEVVDSAAELELTGAGIRAGYRGTLEPGWHPLHIRLRPRHRAAATLRPRITIRRHGSGSGKVLLNRIWINDPAGNNTPAAISVHRQADRHDGLVVGHGFYDLEQFGKPARPGRWTGTEAKISLPAGQGQLAVSLCAPRPGAAQVELSCRAERWQRSVEITGAWQEQIVPVTGRHGRVTLRLTTANPLNPSRDIPGAADSRDLGVVLGEIRFIPAAPANP